MKLKYTASHSFVKKFSKLDSRIKKRCLVKIDSFLEDPYSPPLKTHKLSGKLKEFWAFSIEYNLRILFRFKNDKEVEFIDIGTHSVYR